MLAGVNLRARTDGAAMASQVGSGGRHTALARLLLAGVVNVRADGAALASQLGTDHPTQAGIGEDMFTKAFVIRIAGTLRNVDSVPWLA